MNPAWVRWAEHVHGHVACLATVALFHPAALLRRPGRRALSAATAATALVTLSGALGLMLYPNYRLELKPAITAASASLATSFERKEHLAVGVMLLAWVGLIAHYADCHGRDSIRSGPRVAHIAYTGAAMLASITALLGVAVAVHWTF